MDPNRLGTLLEIGVAAAIVLGVAGILLGQAVLTAIGVLLVIAGLIGLMPALRYTVLLEQSADS